MTCEHRKNKIDYYLNTRNDGKCRICRSEIVKKCYNRNKEKILKKCADYRKNNPDKIKEIRKKYKVIIKKPEIIKT